MIKRILPLLFLLSLTLSLKASRPVVLSPDTEHYILHYDYVDILEDNSARLILNEIRGAGYKTRFIKNTEARAVNKNIKAAYWLRLVVKNERKDDRKWLVEFYDHKTDNIEFYEKDKEGKYINFSGGDNVPFSKKYLKHKNIEFSLNVPEYGAADTFFVRIQSEFPIKMIPVIRTFEWFTFYSLNEYYFLGIYYGLLLAMIIYNFILFVSIRDKSYLYYILYVGSFGLFSMCQDGTAFQYIWPNHPEFNNNSFAFALFSMVIWALLYARSFLITRIYNHFWNTVLINAIRVRILVFIIGLTIFPKLLYMMWLDLIPLFICYLAGVFALSRGYSPARYYVLGFSLLFLGLVFTMLDIFPHKPIVFYSSNIGSVLEMMVLSIALTDRIKTFKKDKEVAEAEMIRQLEVNQELKDKANKELEQRVKERTRELEVANHEIQRMNALLNEENENLEINLKELSKARVMLKDVDFEEFSQIYPDEDSCYKFLAELKWKDEPHKCYKCGHEKFSPGRAPYSRRCTKCGFDESPIANTIFAGIKFPIVKAFYIVFLYYSSKKRITSTELSRILVLRQKTCWSFMQKIIDSGTSKKEASSWTDLILDPE